MKNSMRKQLTLYTLLVIGILAAATVAQLPPTTVPQRRPSLKRDRTLQVVLPKILQNEDERTPSNELIDLMSPLNANNGAARRRAILALGRIGYPSAVPALTEVLKIDRSPEMRALAAFSLGGIE